MPRLDRQKLHVNWMPGCDADGPLLPRTYTLTHSDATGDLFLTIGPQHELRQISGWYTRLMRDEVLGTWQVEQDGARLHVYCHVSGGLAVGSAAWREAIFRQELPLVLEAFRSGDGRLVELCPELDQAPVWVHFHFGGPRKDVEEYWGTFGDYHW
jgi:hypothetical protein